MLRCRLQLRCCLAALVTLISAATSLAQVISSNIDPTFTRGEFERVQRELSLSNDQKQAADDLHKQLIADLQTQGRGLSEEYLKAYNVLQDSKDDGPLKKYRDTYADFVDARIRKEEAFWLKFKSLLTPEQQEKDWPRVLRARHRRSIQDLQTPGPVMWGRLNLIDIVENSKLPPEQLAAAAPVLTRYELEIDRPLSQHVDKWVEARLEIKGVAEQAARLRESEWALGREVFEINRKYASARRSPLSGDAASQVEHTIHSIVYSYISWVHRDAPDLMKRSLALPDLTDAQKERLKIVADAHEKQFAVLAKECEAIFDQATTDEMSKPTRELAKLDQELADPALGGRLEMNVANKLRQFDGDAAKSIMAVLNDKQKKVVMPPQK